MADYARPFFSQIKNKITKQLARNGYVYTKRYTYKGSNYWVCTERSICGAAVVEKDGTYRECKNGWANGRHINHVPDSVKVAEKLCFGEAKRVAFENPTKSAGDIYDEITKDVDIETQATLPPEYLMKKYICRYKTCPELFSDPKEKKSLSIPPLAKLTIRGKSFLRYDCDGTKDILIFTTTANLKELSCCDVWISDGTFKTSPKIYGAKGQLFSIHGVFHKYDERGQKVVSASLPLVYAVLFNKLEATYNTFLKSLLKIESQILLQPKMLIMDFEKAPINAFASIFPKAKIRGCYFHLTQNILRKVQEEGLQIRYNNDDHFALQVRYLYSLAFVKPSHVRKRFAETVNVLDPAIQPIAKYFFTTYVGSDWDP